MKLPETKKCNRKDVKKDKKELLNNVESILVEHFQNPKKCQNLKCLKIQKIDEHFKKCCKIKTCRWCKEYFALICYHTLRSCKNYLNCAVPYCKPIGLKYFDSGYKVR
jgi:hypothetical protein